MSVGSSLALPESSCTSVRLGSVMARGDQGDDRSKVWGPGPCTSRTPLKRPCGSVPWPPSFPAWKTTPNAALTRPNIDGGTTCRTGPCHHEVAIRPGKKKKKFKFVHVTSFSSFPFRLIALGPKGAQIMALTEVRLHIMCTRLATFSGVVYCKHSSKWPKS